MVAVKRSKPKNIFFFENCEIFFPHLTNIFVCAQVFNKITNKLLDVYKQTSISSK